MPDEWVEEYWEDLPPEAQLWYERYAKAVYYGNMDILQELCNEAPSDQFDSLKEEIAYERRSHERNTYTIPKSRYPRYSEHDYCWAASMAEHHPKVDARYLIDTSYDREATKSNMKWAQK